MIHNTWFVPEGSGEPISPYERSEQGETVAPAGCFALSLKMVSIDRNLEGFLRNKNSFIILSVASIGDNPKTHRIHFFDQVVPFNKPVGEFISPFVFWCDDFPGDQDIDLEIILMEVDTDAGERRETIKASRVMASFAGAAYPLVLPFLQIPAEVNVAIDKIFKALNTGAHMVHYPLKLSPGGKKGAFPRLGDYILFPNPTDAAPYQLNAKGELVRKDREPAGASYVVLRLERKENLAPRWVILEKAAGFLSQINRFSREQPLRSLNLLEETMKQGLVFQRLLRYMELKSKSPQSLAPAEKILFERLEKDSFIRFLIDHFA